jgi:hypothetical protein
VDLSAIISQAGLGAGAIFVVWMFLAGKLHTDAEFRRVVAERDQYRAALEAERKAVNETAQAASVTNRLLSAVVDLAAERQGVPRHPMSPAEENGP